MVRSKKKNNLVQIKLIRSPIGYPEKQKNTVRALGLRRMQQTVEIEDTPVLRGMLAKISHLVQVAGEE